MSCGGAPVSGPSAADHAAGHPGAPHGGHDGHGGHAAHDHDFSDVERFAALFDAPDRDAWQKPDEVVRLLALDPGATVVDLGTGTGYFLPHLSRAVGERGRVVGLDVEPNMIAHVEERVRREGLPNVEARVCATDDPGLAPASVDRILVVNTWHHIADRPAYAERLSAALRPGGFVLVVDFTEESEHGPPPEMRLSPETVISELGAGGLEAAVVEEAMPMSYAVRATRR